MAKEDEDPIAAEGRPYIPEGKYSCQCISARKTTIGQKTRHGTFARTPKILLGFKVIDGPHTDTILQMYLNAEYKKFRPGSKFYQAWVIATGRRPGRRDRMPLDVFKNHIFTVGVKTVKPTFSDGTERPTIFQYSKVDEIYEKEA